VEFELHFLEPVGYVLAINATDEDFPTVGMVGRGIFWAVCRIERRSFGAVD
jgi:hypothetical protein